jgi:hypothetical protein
MMATDHPDLKLEPGQSVIVTRCAAGGYAVTRCGDPLVSPGKDVRGFTNAHDMCAWLRRSLVAKPENQEKRP